MEFGIIQMEHVSTPWHCCTYFYFFYCRQNNNALLPLNTTGLHSSSNTKVELQRLDTTTMSLFWLQMGALISPHMNAGLLIQTNSFIRNFSYWQPWFMPCCHATHDFKKSQILLTKWLVQVAKKHCEHSWCSGISDTEAAWSTTGYVE